jgi:uncharacterized protein YndB with AHSA1/START domain
MLKKILLTLAVLIIVLVVVVATRPADFRISRSAVIPAPPAAVFAQIDDLHKWNDWSPWAKLDPNAKNSFDGPASGVGAKFSWAGNNEVGEGTMTITESKPSELVVMRLDFKRPFEATSTAEFALKPDGSGTAVTWTMSGRNNFIGKAISLCMDCDKMVGGQFEKGLENLKSAVTKP